MKRKLSNRQAVNFFVVLVLLIFVQEFTYSQVFTRILEENERLSHYIPWYFEEAPKALNMPTVDVQAALKKDEKHGNRLHRFGVKQNVNHTISDGEFYSVGAFIVWKLKIHSKGAKTLNFHFSDLNLPENGKMFIYGTNKRMVHGPIIADHVHSGIYNSDVVSGEEVIIEVLLERSTVNEFQLQIDAIIHGIDNIFYENKSFGNSEPCNVNVACPAGAGLEDQIDAVCMALRGDGSNCTGTLINNECNDLTPFVLTAEHCTDNGENVNNWSFRFRYETSVCTGGLKPKKNQWISFSGAQLRASSIASDFALLELNSTIPSYAEVAFAGWDRSATIPTNSTMIHHPKCDVKKITFDAGAAIIDAAPPLGLGGGMAFMLTLSNGAGGDFGVTEQGSSGCAQFNQNQRIVGQNTGGDPSTCSNTTSKWYGRFFNSWTGGGTAATMLSSWLGGVSNPMTTNAVRVPTINGDEIICTGNNVFSLQNPLPGYSVSWEVTPASLFSSATFGNGTTANLSADNANSQGAATLTFTLVNNDCMTTRTFTKQLWVGKPKITGIREPECYKAGGLYVLKANSQGATAHNWTFPSCEFPLPDPTCWNYFNTSGLNQIISVQAGNQPEVGNLGTIIVTATNECGTTTFSQSIIWCNDDGGFGGPKMLDTGGKPSKTKVLIYPNPVEKTLYLKLFDERFLSEDLKTLEIFSLSGNRILTTTDTAYKVEIKVDNLPSGTYYLRVSNNEYTQIEKFIIQ